MTLRVQRRLLWLLADGLLAACLAILALGLTRPLARADFAAQDDTMADGPSAHQSESPAELTEGTSELNAEPDLESLLRLAARNYRQRLFDPPPQPVQAKPPPPLPPFRLVGTVLNPDRPLAMIADERGRISLKTIGDKVGEPDNIAVITAIEAELVRLLHNDREVTVKKE